MTHLSVVADASPLIALEQIDLLDRCEPLFVSCVIPPAVHREIAPTVRHRPWIAVRRLAAPIDPRILSMNLDPGEKEALGLALQLRDHRVLVDERSARRFAITIGLSVIGTVGLLVVAKSAGVLSEVRPSLEALLAAGFFLSADIIDQALRSAGETAL